MGSREQEFHKRRQRAMAEAATQRAIQAGDTRVFPVDRFGAPVTPGSKIIYRPEFDFVYDVLEIRPVLDPKAPPGWISVTMVTETTLTIPAGMVQMNMVRIGTTESADDSKLSDAPPPPDPPAEPPPGPRLVLTDVQ